MTNLPPTTRLILEVLYGALLPAVNVARGFDNDLHGALLATVVQLARVLGVECPVETRKERRQVRGTSVLQSPVER